MSGTNLRELGTTATLAPNIKRATCVLSNQRAVAMVPDTNISTANGDDVTGIAKIYLYVSGVEGVGPWTATAYTPAVAPSSATRKFVGSMINGDGTVVNNIYVAYTGTDNSLRLITFSSYNGTTGWGSVTEQTIVTGNAVTNRYRAIDISVTPQGNVGVIVYEATASSGQGSSAKIYIRNNDGTTWRLAYNDLIFGVSFIMDGGEDATISFDVTGGATTVKIAAYYTLCSTVLNDGGRLRNLTYNVATGTDNSATLVGSWYTFLNAKLANGAHRGWLFSDADSRWVFGTSVGTSAPFFEGIKLQHNVFTGMVRNKIATVLSKNPLVKGYSIFRDANKYSPITAVYSDNKLIFAYAGVGHTTSRAVRALLMKWSSTTAADTSYMDSTARYWDQNFLSPGAGAGNTNGVISVYAGMNKRNNVSDQDYYILAIYGAFGNSVSAVEDELERRARIMQEDSLPLPVIMSPIGVTVQNDTPLLQTLVNPTALYTNTLWKAQWQLARDASFTVDVRTITQPDSDLQSFSSPNGVTIPIRTLTYQLVAAEALYSGTWFIRSRITDDLGTVSAWTDPEIDSFEVSHPPVALPKAPTTGTIQEYDTGDVLFTWGFSDTEPSDVQSAYQLIVERQDTGAVIHDSGKVVSSDKSVTVNIAVGLLDIPLQWSIRLWDSDDVSGVYSNPLLFTLASAPTVAVTTPAEAAVVTTATPTFQWSFSSVGGYTQRAYRVIVYDTAPSPDESVADSGWVFSSTTSHQFATNILTDAGSYRVEVYAMDSANMQGTDSNNFTTDWIEPALGDISLTSDDFKITVSWTDANIDLDYVSWRVYRKYLKTAIVEIDVDDTDNTWVLLYETDEVLTNYEYLDYTAPLNKSVSYLVVQVADRFGSLVESDLAAGSSIIQSGDKYFFVPEVIIGSIASFEASNVNGDSFTDEVERETLHVIGRGRQVQIGDDLGYAGTLTINLRNPETARRDREFLELLSSDDTGNLYIKSPFGDVLYVRLGNIATARQPGMGTSDIVNLTVPYEEVFQETQITRTV